MIAWCCVTHAQRPGRNNTTLCADTAKGWYDGQSMEYARPEAKSARRMTTSDGPEVTCRKPKTKRRRTKNDEQTTQDDGRRTEDGGNTTNTGEHARHRFHLEVDTIKLARVPGSLCDMSAARGEKADKGIGRNAGSSSTLFVLCKANCRSRWAWICCIFSLMRAAQSRISFSKPSVRLRSFVSSNCFWRITSSEGFAGDTCGGRGSRKASVPKQLNRRHPAAELLLKSPCRARRRFDTACNRSISFNCLPCPVTINGAQHYTPSQSMAGALYLGTTSHRRACYACNSNHL